MKAFVFCLVASFVAVVNADEQYTLDSVKSYFDRCAAEGKPIKPPRLHLNRLSQVGHVGSLSESPGTWTTFNVMQQIEEGTLVTIRRTTEKQMVNGSRGPITIGGEDTTSGPFLFKYATITSLPTDGRFQPNGLWQVSGTFTYATAVGSSRTILVVEPLPDGALQVPDKMPHRFLYKHTARQWNKLNGESFAHGIYLGYKDGVIWVMTPESEIEKSSLFDLSKEDQLFVRQQLKERRRTWLIPEIEKELKDKAAKQ